MRDLEGIAEINGPRRAELQAERAANIRTNSSRLPAKSVQEAHGRRLEARQAQRQSEA